MNLTKNDKNHYPFGSPMVGRGWEAGNIGDYRFGFNGQEKENQINGSDGGHLVYEYRIHDSRICRFLSVDPLGSEYPWNSVYAFAENRVIDGVELEGREFISADESRINIIKGKAYIKVSSMSDAFIDALDQTFGHAGWRLNDPDREKDPLELGIIFLPEKPKKPGEEEERKTSTEAQTAKSTGSPDRRVKPRNVETQFTPGVVRVNLIMIAIEIYEMTNKYFLYNDLNAIRVQSIVTYDGGNETIPPLQQATDLLFKNLNMVNEKYRSNIEALGEIANVILQGETVKGNQELYQIGLDILEKEGILKLNQFEMIKPRPGTGKLDYLQLNLQIKTRSKSEMIDPALPK